MIQVSSFKVKVHSTEEVTDKELFCLQVGKYVEFVMADGTDPAQVVGEATAVLMRKINEARDKVPEQGSQTT